MDILPYFRHTLIHWFWNTSGQVSVDGRCSCPWTSLYLHPLTYLWLVMWRTQIEDKHEGWMQLEHWILGYLWSTAYSECHTEIVHGFCKYQSFIQYNHDHTKWVQNGLCHRLSILIQFYSYLLILGLRAQLPRNGLHLMPHLLFASFHFLPNLHCGQQPDNNIYIVSKLLMCWIYIDWHACA